MFLETSLVESVRVRTRRVPKKFIFSASASASYNTETTFRERLAHRGGNLDFLGIDDGTRSLPDSIPNYKLARGANKPSGDPLLAPDLKGPGEELNTYMTSVRRFSPPNHGLSLVFGDGWKLGAQRRLGFVGSVNYKRGYKLRHEISRNFKADTSSPTGVAATKDLEKETGSEEVNWGAFGSILYDFDRDHHLNLLGFHSQLADNDTYLFEGRNEVDNADFTTTRFKFVSRSLDVVQLHGKSRLSELGDAELKWHLGYSVARRNEPDTRDVAYGKNDSATSFSYVDRSGQHFFSDQSEKAITLSADWDQPLSSGEDAPKIKVGGLASLKDRNFRARRFVFQRTPGVPSSEFLCPGSSYDPSCTDNHFAPDRIGPFLQLEETTQPTDAYDAELNVLGAYLMANVGFAKLVRLVVGQRLEITRQTLAPFDQFDEGVEVEGASLNSTDLFASGSRCL